MLRFLMTFPVFKDLFFSTLLNSLKIMPFFPNTIIHINFIVIKHTVTKTCEAVIMVSHKI